MSRLCSLLHVTTLLHALHLRTSPQLSKVQSVYLATLAWTSHKRRYRLLRRLQSRPCLSHGRASATEGWPTPSSLFHTFILSNSTFISLKVPASSQSHHASTQFVSHHPSSCLTVKIFSLQSCTCTCKHSTSNAPLYPKLTFLEPFCTPLEHPGHIIRFIVASPWRAGVTLHTVTIRSAQSERQVTQGLAQAHAVPKTAFAAL